MHFCHSGSYLQEGRCQSTLCSDPTCDTLIGLSSAWTLIIRSSCIRSSNNSWLNSMCTNVQLLIYEQFYRYPATLTSCCGQCINYTPWFFRFRQYTLQFLMLKNSFTFLGDVSNDEYNGIVIPWYPLFLFSQEVIWTYPYFVVRTKRNSEAIF